MRYRENWANKMIDDALAVVAGNFFKELSYRGEFECTIIKHRNFLDRRNSTRKSRIRVYPFDSFGKTSSSIHLSP